MWNAPTPEELAEKVPPMYSTDGTKAGDKLITAHFFIGGSDWWVCEYDPETDEAFGFSRLNGDDQMSEWGYIPIDELRKIKVRFTEVDYDCYWQPKKASEIDGIKTF